MKCKQCPSQKIYQQGLCKLCYFHNYGIKNTCKCGADLMIPSWTKCEKCSYKPKHKKPMIPETPKEEKQKIVVTPKIKLVMEKKEVERIFKFACDPIKALKSDLLLYDEKWKVIGHRNPLFRLKQ